MSSRPLGFGRGLGRGAGARKPGALSNGTAGLNAPTSSVGGGGGFDEDAWDESGVNGSSSGWDETPSQTGDSYGGGRSSGNSGFGRTRNGDGGNRGKGCFKCGEEGHMSRECPNSTGGRRGGSACYKCGEEGHMSRECPKADSSGGRRGACYKCGEEGHMSRECPKADSSGGRRGACYKCGEEGHMSRECPKADSSGGRRGGSACYKCGEEGHMSRECPKADSSERRGGGGACYKCGEEGHISRDCPQGGGGGGEKKGCFRCGEDGHMARECPKPLGEGEKPREIYIPPAVPESEEEMFRSITKGINFDKYDQIPVEVTGRNPVGFISSFDEAGFYDTCMKNVRRANYTIPTPVQKYAIPIIMAGRDLMACAQTGSGKTAAFLLPVITGMIRNGLTSSSFCPVQMPQAVVVAPTRELAIQINHDAHKFAYQTDVRAVVLYGGTSVGHQIQQVAKGANIVVGTPGRLLDIINKGRISLEKVQYLVLDEADRMLDMGFEPDIRRLVQTMGMPPKTERQTLMFSATFPEEIQKLAADFLNDYLFVTVGRVGGANTDVTQVFYEVERHVKREKLCSILSDSGHDRTLVFVEQKRNADFLASYLSQSGFPTTSIHGDRLQREREEALRDFKTAKAPVLIATSVAARGLDIPDVKHVINYDLPSSIDEYVHRIGRTGRCGNLGKATSFFSSDSDSPLASSLVRILSEAKQEVPDWLEAYASYGGGFGDGGSSSRFASKDIRRGVDHGSNYSVPTTSAFGGGDDDGESWD